MLRDIVADVVRKDIKHVYFRVSAATGEVRISAPRRMSIDTIRMLTGEKFDWIRRQQARIREHPPAAPLRYVEGETHTVWGEPVTLAVRERSAPPAVVLEAGALQLSVRPGANESKRRAVAERWYREQISAAVEPLLATWQPLMDVQVERVFVRRMKTRWGSCNYRANSIRLNTELARRSPGGLEYVVVHELVHLLEPSHNARFYALMDRFMPDWRFHRKALDLSPIAG